MALRFEKALRIEIVGVIGFYLLICFFILAFSPTALLYVGHDVSPVLDGAWRIENNQIPHKDFSSILGHGYLLQQLLFLRLFHYDFIAFSVSSIAVATVMLTLFLSFYHFPVFLKNTTPTLRIYFFILLVCLGLGQYHFGEKHTLLTYANLYNRYGFLSLFVFSIQTLLWKDVEKATSRTVTQLSIAVMLLNYLIFIKLTYFIIAFGLLSFCLLIEVVSFSVYWRILLFTLLIFLVFSLAFGADALAIINDYKTIASVRGGELMRPGFIRYKLFQYYNVIFLLSLLLFIAEAIYRKVALKLVVLVCFIGVSAVFLQFTNWGTTDIVMLTFVPVVFLLSPELRTFITSKIFLAVCCFFLFKNLRSIYYLSKENGARYPEVKSQYLSRFYTNFTEVGCELDYAPWIVSGTALADKNKKIGDRIFSFSFDNPFPFLTHTVPPKHVSTVWQYGTTYSNTVHIPPQQLFNEVDLLLIPRCPLAESAAEMKKIYGAKVKEHYSLIDSNEYWLLYRKTRPL